MIYHIKLPLSIVVILLTAALLAGCGEEPTPESFSGTIPNAAVSMEDTPVVDYVVPMQLPNILVNRQGYDAGDEKTAVVRGRELPESFQLVNALTGEIVYRGSLQEAAYDEELAIYTGYARFSHMEEAGSYYIECDMIGRSYSFVIQEQLYETLFQETYELLMEACEDHTLTISQAVGILEAYEWYSQAFSDQDKNQIPDVLEALRGWVTYMEGNGIDPGQEALYAAFLAKFSYHYQKFDYKYATECLQRASTVFGQQDEQSMSADSFLALTELYRAANLSAYGKQIMTYKSYFEDNNNYSEERSYLYGSMTYLVTRHSVNMELCQLFINHVMGTGEEAVQLYHNTVYPVEAGNNDSGDLLIQALELSCANYVLNNYQYTNIIEEFLHYLMGRNLESANFYESSQDGDGYLLLFAQLAADHEARHH